ncbi:MAG TPA: hypothetical protein VHE14_08545 [Solirubrobacteraceae bacterium]|nr:hypothetical protein [Solirubrobacteraceae bacterium]
MTALQPEDALDQLAALSIDVRAGVVLDAAGRRLAGSSVLAGPAAQLLDAAPASAIEVVTERGAVFAVRSPQRALAVVTGRPVVASLVLYDLRRVLAELEPRPA